jgi:hypothetical protein
MRDRWYGDNRDLVKWGVLLSVAKDHAVDRILQVAYLRASVWSLLTIDGQERPLPEAVLRHFRDIRNVKALSAGIRIEVVDTPFVDRHQYREVVLEAIAHRDLGESCVVFLDPDTGLTPRTAGFQHVLDSELNEIWQHMIPGDVLVLYQHQTNRNATPWIQPKREQFETALGLSPGTAQVATGGGIANDVAFFYSCKRSLCVRR